MLPQLSVSRPKHEASPNEADLSSRREDDAAGSKGRPRSVSAPVTVIWGDLSSQESSIELAGKANALTKSHQLIWIDLYEVATLEVLVGLLFQDFHRLDPGLVPESLRRRRDEKDAEYVAWLAERVAIALKRGTYVIALNWGGEFGRHELAHHNWGASYFDDSVFDHAKGHRSATMAAYVALGQRFDEEPSEGDLTVRQQQRLALRTLTQIDETARDESARLFQFLERLAALEHDDPEESTVHVRAAKSGREPTARRPMSLGESRVYLAFTPPDIPVSIQDARAVVQALHDSLSQTGDKLTDPLRKALEAVSEVIGRPHSALESARANHSAMKSLGTSRLRTLVPVKWPMGAGTACIVKG